MKVRAINLATILAAGLLTGCQTSLVGPNPERSSKAMVEHPFLAGPTRFTVTLENQTYVGIAEEPKEDTTGQQALDFGWKLRHHHPSLQPDEAFLYGTSALVSDSGKKLRCDYLKHNEDWRLRCKDDNGVEVMLKRPLNSR